MTRGHPPDANTSWQQGCGHTDLTEPVCALKVPSCSAMPVSQREMVWSPEAASIQASFCSHRRWGTDRKRFHMCTSCLSAREAANPALLPVPSLPPRQNTLPPNPAPQHACAPPPTPHLGPRNVKDRILVRQPLSPRLWLVVVCCGAGEGHSGVHNRNEPLLVCDGKELAVIVHLQAQREVRSARGGVCE